MSHKMPYDVIVGMNLQVVGGGELMTISDDQLNKWRVEARRIRVIRDADPANDVKGIVVAWDDDTVLIRKQNRRVVKLPRSYVFQPLELEREH